VADLVTTAEYKAYANISVTTWDTQIGVLIDIACEILRSECGRDLTTGFESAARTEYYEGTGTDTLQLREWPVATLTSVTQVDAENTAIGSAYDASTYYLENAGASGLLRWYGSASGRFAASRVGLGWYDTNPVDGFGTYPAWCSGSRYKVVYTGGYGTIPNKVKFAVYQLIDLLRAEAATGASTGLKSESIVDYSYTRESVTGAGKAERIAAIVAPLRTGGL